MSEYSRKQDLMGTIKRATGNDKTVGKISKSIVKN